MSEKPFDYKDWEAVICTEVGEKVVCDRCKNIVKSEVIGEHLFCKNCGKYIWRKKYEM